jgi:hypothetical protein
LISNEPHIGDELVENLRQKICIHCGSINLKPFLAIEQEMHRPNEYWHAIIAICKDCGKGQLERTYYDCSDTEEIFDQTEWYLLDKISMNRLADLIMYGIQGKYAPCPEPKSPKCLCGVHWQLNEALSKLESTGSIEIQRKGGTVQIEFIIRDIGSAEFQKTK